MVLVCWVEDNDICVDDNKKHDTTADIEVSENVLV